MPYYTTRVPQRLSGRVVAGQESGVTDLCFDGRQNAIFTDIMLVYEPKTEVYTQQVKNGTDSILEVGRVRQGPNVRESVLYFRT